MTATAKQIRSFVREGRTAFRPIWDQMRKDREFYANKSWLNQDLQVLEERGQRPVTVNVTAPACDLIQGMLVASKQDLQAKPMVSAGAPVGKQATWALKHVGTINHLEKRRSDVTRDSVQVGAGYMLVGDYVRDRDPLAERAQVKNLDPIRVWFDLSHNEALLEDARYIGYSEWFDFKAIAKEFPKFRTQLLALKGQNAPPETDVEVFRVPLETGDTVSIPPLYLWGAAEWNLADQHDELDRNKDRVLVHQVWYKTKATSHFYVGKEGYPRKFDPQKNPEVFIKPDVTRIFQSSTTQVRRAIMAGPYLLDDRALPVPQYPVIPFFWKRDEKNRPFSFIKQIADLQAEYNATKARHYYDLISRQIQVGEEYFVERTEADLEDVKDNVAKPNGVIVGDGIMPWMSNSQMIAERLLQIGREINEAAGVTENLAGVDSGKSPKSAASKQQSTLQAGMTFEARKRDLEHAFRHLGDVLLQYIIKLHPDPWAVMVSDEKSGQDWLQTIKLEDIPHLVEIDVAPFSPTLAEKQAETLMNLLPRLPQDAKLQTVGLMMALNAMNIPGTGELKELLADYVRRIESGQVPPNPMPEPAQRPRTQHIKPRTA